MPTLSPARFWGTSGRSSTGISAPQQTGGVVKQRFSVVVLALVCFTLGAVVQRFYDARRPQGRQQAIQSVRPPAETNTPAEEDKGGVSVEAIRFDHEPLWAY